MVIRTKRGIPAMDKTLNLLRVLSILLLIGFPGNPASAQKRLSIKPTVGMQAVFSDFTIRPLYSTQSRLGRAFDGSSDFWSCLIQYEVNPKVRLAAGISESDLSLGYRITTPTSAVRQVTLAPLLQFPLKADLLLKENIRVGRLDPIGNHFAMIFNWYATAGVSLDWFRFDNFEGAVLSAGINDPRLDRVEVSERLPNVVRRLGASVQAGFGFQFKNRDKDRIDIQIVYSKGLQKMVLMDVDFKVNGSASALQTAARGSAFRLTLSYPIRLGKRVERPAE